MAMSGKILDLRNLLAIRFPQAPLLVETRLVTGSASIDQPIGGGLPKGAITELISPREARGVHRSFTPSSMAHIAINISWR